MYRCVICNHEEGPIYLDVNEGNGKILGTCPVCANKKSIFHLEEFQSVYRNYQKWTI